MSKKQARKMLAEAKPGCTVKEFLKACSSFSFWFDDILGTEYEEIFYILSGQEAPDEC